MWKYSRLGRLFLEEENRSDDFYVDGFLDYLKKISHDLNLPALKHYGISNDDLERISSITEMKNNPVKLDLDEVIEIIADQI